MKTNLILTLASVGFILTGCGNGSGSAPSIKNNSVHKEVSKKEDYSGIAPSKLLRHIQAHYDLGQYVNGKDKLNYLMEVYPDTLDGINLVDLKNQMDAALLKDQQEKQALAQAEVNKRLPNAVNKMRIINEGKTTYYYDLSSPEFDTKECFYAYIKKDIYGAHLYFKARYVGTTWLNMETMMVTVDKLDYTVEGEVIKSETKGKKAYKHELYDFEVTTEDQMKTLKAIANGTDVIALFIGKDTYKKRDITQEQRLAFRNVLDAYTFLSGNKLDPIKSGITNSDN